MFSYLILGITVAVVIVFCFVFPAKKKSVGKKSVEKKDDSTYIPTVSVSKDDILNNKLDKLNRKLDKIYDVLNHIRWIGLGLAGLFTVTFILPQCARL
jgi:hypothetical protein